MHLHMSKETPNFVREVLNLFPWKMFLEFFFNDSKKITDNIYKKYSEQKVELAFPPTHPLGILKCSISDPTAAPCGQNIFWKWLNASMNRKNTSFIKIFINTHITMHMVCVGMTYSVSKTVHKRYPRRKCSWKYEHWHCENNWRVWCLGGRIHT